MRHETELRVKVQLPNDSEPRWYPLDLGSGNTLTLDFVSNLLSDVSKISSSRSFTVKLPRTRRNDTVLDLAVVPQHQSERPYRYLPCRVYVDGIDVSDKAYMYLVSSEAATYNAVIVFGLMQEYKEWVDAGKSLKELEDTGQSIPWNWRAAYIFTPGTGSPHDPVDYPPIWWGNDANMQTYTPANGIGQLMYYGIYTPGFERDDKTVSYANVHPFVTVRELWERIVNENSLDFNLPNWVKLDMEDLAIVLTKIGGNTPQSQASDNHAIETDEEWSLAHVGNMFYYLPAIKEDGYIERYSSRALVVKQRGDGVVRLSVGFMLKGQAVEWLMNRLGNDVTKMRLLISDFVSNETAYIEPLYQYDSTANEWRLYYMGSYNFAGGLEEDENIGALQIKFPTAGMGGDDVVYNYFDSIDISAIAPPPADQGIVAGISSYQGTIDYPNPDFMCFPNLPDMKQLDFVKMVCHLYGLFPCQRGNAVDFVPIEELEENKDNAYDWSGYLLEDDPDAPHHTDWHMTELARRNRVSYKKDSKDQAIDEAWFTVDDDTLDREKDFLTIPLAASEGDNIPQYELTPVYDDSTTPPAIMNYDVDFTECEHRLMRVVEWYNENENTVTRLAFQNLSSSFLIAERYENYQGYVNQPRIVTERLRVPLPDLRTLDYSRPVFLSKYGSHFAIIDIKWTATQDTCEAKLLMMPASSSTPELVRVEYLESDGLQFIDTGVVPDDNTGIEIEFENINTTGFVCGCSETGQYVAVGLSLAGNASNVMGRWGSDTPSLQDFTSGKARLNYLNDRTFTWDGNVGTAISLNSLGYTPTKSIYLFGINKNGTPYLKRSRIKRAKITQGGTVIRDYVAVRVGDVGYLKDTIHNRLYGNDGTGAFIIG